MDLANVEISFAANQLKLRVADFDFRDGKTDFLEYSLRHRARFYAILSLIFILTILVGLIGLYLRTDIFASSSSEEVVPLVIESASPRPTLNIATVTQGPPTATYTLTPLPTATPSDTPTRGPCMITMPQGQSLIWALGQCGHQSLDVMPTILAINNLADAGQVRSGQTIEIPWPTSTEDPFAQASETPAESAQLQSDENESSVAVNEAIEAFAATTTPTLPPGVMWHQIQPQENIISVAVQYRTDVQTLSQLNRQVDFARCDFGETYGGPECLVQLFQGQMLRVPAPTATATLSPTPDPNATSTPTATPTFNQPNVFSPSDRQFFYVNELVTLRWIPSATLNTNETYRVDVRDTTSGINYVAFTNEVFFTIPQEWQGTQQDRHEFVWTVSVVNQQNLDAIRFQTEPRSFVWQGKLEGDKT
jgi:hypothetical protein